MVAAFISVNHSYGECEQRLLGAPVYWFERSGPAVFKSLSLLLHFLNNFQIDPVTS